MSREIRKCNNRGLGSIAVTNEGTDQELYFYVDSCFTWDHGYETMAFPYSMKEEKVTSWGEYVQINYSDEETMKIGHEHAINNLEGLIDEYLHGY